MACPHLVPVYPAMAAPGSQVGEEEIKILPWPPISEDTEADARARCLLDLLENGLYRV